MLPTRQRYVPLMVTSTGVWPHWHRSMEKKIRSEKPKHIWAIIGQNWPQSALRIMQILHYCLWQCFIIFHVVHVYLLDLFGPNTQLAPSSSSRWVRNAQKKVIEPTLSSGNLDSKGLKKATHFFWCTQQYWPSQVFQDMEVWLFGWE